MACSIWTIVSLCSPGMCTKTSASEQGHVLYNGQWSTNQDRVLVLCEAWLGYWNKVYKFTKSLQINSIYYKVITKKNTSYIKTWNHFFVYDFVTIFHGKISDLHSFYLLLVSQLWPVSYIIQHIRLLKVYSETDPNLAQVIVPMPGSVWLWVWLQVGRVVKPESRYLFSIFYFTKQLLLQTCCILGNCCLFYYTIPLRLTIN